MPVHLPPISRRRFLAGSLAAGAGFLLSPLRAAERAADPDRWVLISDTHVWERRDEGKRDIVPAAALADAVRDILALDPPPCGIIHCGDTVFDEGHAGDYAVLADLVRPIRQAGIPMHFVMGNHDERENFWRAFPDARPRPPAVPGQHVSILSTPRVNWFLLDSLHKTKLTPGLLGGAQLDWLAAALDARADKPALLVAHHNLGAAGSLRDTEALFELIRPRKQVKAYVFGHTHTWGITRQQAIHLINVPTTAWTFAKAQARGWVDLKLGDGGARLVLRTLDKEHPQNGEQVELVWRA